MQTDTHSGLFMCVFVCAHVLGHINMNMCVCVWCICVCVCVRMWCRGFYIIDVEHRICLFSRPPVFNVTAGDCWSVKIMILMLLAL
jgi:hypothetical protein